MNEEYIEVKSENFDDIVEDIKQRNLSRNYMPKLIIGTGLSAIYKVPGMKELAEHLEEEINNSSNEILKKIWKKHSTKIKENGLEAGLGELDQNENDVVEAIRPMTAEFILESEEKLHNSIEKENTGFCKLLIFLSGTVSVDQRMIDIMTPNYDRIIEIICDKLGIGVINGFFGNMYSRFNRDLLQRPTDFFNCKEHVWIRLFKPHGSINWINEEGKEYLTNDYHILKEKVGNIEIVTPGCSKYKEGMTNNTFRCIREEFNKLLNQRNNFSLLIYGYGFNDDHFDTALFDSFQKNVLILSRDVKPNIIAKALEKKNLTVFYHENGKECMVYKSKKYIVDRPIWDINVFADIFIG